MEYRSIHRPMHRSIYRSRYPKRYMVQNVLFSFPQRRLRSKFKKLVSECKPVASTIKTASGIQRFQEEKGYSVWFSKLFEFSKNM